MGTGNAPLPQGKKRGRPAAGNDTLAATALQGSLLAQAAVAGVPVSQETLLDAATALVRFSEADLRALEVIKESPIALRALATLAQTDPDTFLKHFTNLLEFSKPKLARTEHVGNAAGGAVFITVEARESGPPKDARVVSEQ